MTMREMLTSDQHRRRTEPIASEDSGDPRTLRDTDDQQIEPAWLADVRGRGTQLHSGHRQQVFGARSAHVNCHFPPLPGEYSLLIQCAPSGKAPMALLVFFPRSARARIVATDLLALAHERLRFWRGGYGGLPLIGLLRLFRGHRSVIFGMLIAHVTQIDRLLD